MANNIAVSITADVVDLTAKRAIMSAELKAATKDLNDFAKTASTTGATDELRTSMLASADAVAKTRAQIGLLDGQMKKLAVTNAEEKSVLNIFDRSRLAVIEEGTAKIPIFGSAIADLGPAALAAGAGLLVFGEAAHKAIEAADFAEDIERTAKAIGISTTALQEFDFMAQATGIPVESMNKSLQGLSETIGKVQDNLVRGKQGAQVKVFQLIFGEDDPEKAKKDLRDMGGDIEALMPKILDLSAKLTPTGRAGLAQALKMDPQVLSELTEAKERLAAMTDEAHRMGLIFDEDVIKKAAESAQQVHVASAVIDGEMRKAFVDLAPTIAAGAGGIAHFADEIAEAIRGVKDLLAPVAALAALLDHMSGGKAGEGAKAVIGGAVSAIPVVGPVAQVLDQLAKQGRQSEGHGATGSWEGPKSKADTELEKLIERLGQSNGKGSKGAKGPDVVSEWEAQLHATEVASNDFFGDQTKAELDFWQKKLALVSANSKEYLAVSSKIYDAQKKLAHDAYDDHLATLNDQLEEDRNNWSKEQADWQAKLDFIKSKFGEESKEYKNAYHRFQEAAREHEHIMAQIARDGAKEAIEDLKTNLAAARAIREQNAQSAEGQIRDKAGQSGNPFAEVAAEQQIAALHQQNAQRAVAEDAAAYAAEDALRQQDIARALAVDGRESRAYAQAVNTKTHADTEYYAKKRVMENQATNQAIADQQKIAAAWHSKIDPMVQSAGSALKGLVNGTETWHQALVQIGQAFEDVILQAIEHMVEDWIVKMIMGQTASQTSNATTAMSYAGVAGAAGVASMAAAPFPLDLDAPAFGAQMYETAAVFAGMTGAATGADVIPSDAIIQIHAGERIVPAKDNAKMMAMMDGGGSSSRGGDFHAGGFNTTIHAGGNSDKDIMRAIERNQSHFAKILKGMHRNNQLTFARA